MILCQQCGEQELYGTFFCGECGSGLMQIPPTGTMGAAAGSAEIPTAEVAIGQALLPAGASLGLRRVSTGEIIPLVGREQYTLGRVVTDQAVVPDVDLGRWEGSKHGVSRIHAELRLKDGHLFLVDLESSNGTMINNRRLEPFALSSLSNGDTISLGSLRLQLISTYPD